LITIFLLLYPILPVGLLLFYHSRRVRALFERDGSGSTALEEKPLPHLVLGGLLVFFLLALHLPLLFNGTFPLFGRFLFDFNGLLATLLAILILIVIAWGVFKGRRWAWWSALFYLIFMILSATTTFVATAPADLFGGMQLAETEREILAGVPLQNVHLLLLFVPPLLVTLALLLLWRRDFGLGRGGRIAAGQGEAETA